ncbi:MAG: hypothetical protein JNL82_23240 [Myxococcales bacterium]|nr:hypothetical protein [Myxococcales bacterium]
MRRRLLAAVLLGLVTTLLLALGHRQVGYVRDEGIYFAASRQYAAWAARLLHEPAAALAARERDRAFHFNHEHPALLKIAAGVSARWFAEPGPPTTARQERAPAGLLPLLPEGAAMRLPAQLLAGLAVALLFLAGAALADRPVPEDGRPRPPRASAAPAPPDSPPAPPDSPPAPPDSPDLPWLLGLCAALWFIALPHVWFHAGLHCFDVPVAVATLAVVLIYRRAVRSWRWALALGPALGVAISIKHNALFIPVLLGIHHLACLALAGRRPTRGRWIPLPFVSMALLAPLTVLALWPWLWTDPVGRLQEYVEFHRLHAYYNTEFLHINYNRPPLPIAYPFVLTWATVPTGALLLALTGLVLGLRRDLSFKISTPVPRDTPPGSGFTAPHAGLPARDALLFALFAAFPLALIALPTVPIFGGTKHWLTAYPFLALAAAGGLLTLARAAADAPTPAPGRRLALALHRQRRRLPAAVLVLVLVPGVWSTVDGHPYGLSQYAPLVGGPRGAADLGLLRGFWGHAVPPAQLAADAAPGPTYLHDLHELARLQYEREGRWPAGAAPVAPSRAGTGLIFHERHMLSHELDVWQSLGPAPAEVVTLDDVPLTSLHRRP